jgi:hypothetical protein
MIALRQAIWPTTISDILLNIIVYAKQTKPDYINRLTFDKTWAKVTSVHLGCIEGCP